MTAVVKRGLEILLVVLLAAFVYFATLFARFSFTPSCIASASGLGLPIMSGYLGVAAIAVFVVGTLVVRFCSEQHGLIARLKLHLMMATCIPVAMYVSSLLLYRDPAHWGEHECNLTPWSP